MAESINDLLDEVNRLEAALAVARDKLKKARQEACPYFGKVILDDRGRPFRVKFMEFYGGGGDIPFKVSGPVILKDGSEGRNRRYLYPRSEKIAVVE